MREVRWRWRGVEGGEWRGIGATLVLLLPVACWIRLVKKVEEGNWGYFGFVVVVTLPRDPPNTTRPLTVQHPSLTCWFWPAGIHWSRKGRKV